jgi:signal transduction histidine kinase
MSSALGLRAWDLVLSDYQMPDFTGMEALDLLRLRGLDIPFILVSRVIGEEVAVEAMKRGAHDWVMKDQLRRLLPAVERELREAKVRKEHRASELERHVMEVQLRQAQKLEAIGRLAAGIAHEINTPAQFIGDNTRFLRESFGDLLKVLAGYQRLLRAAKQNVLHPELIAEAEAAIQAADPDYLATEIPKAIEQSLEGIARVTNIVRAMKDFSQPGTNEKTPVNLNQAIESTLTVCRNEWKYVADLVTQLDPSLPPVPCLPGEFNQVILNIVVNAAHAIADVVGDGSQKKGTITVSTRHDGDRAELRICDTGTGMPEQVREKIFDPFFTTRGVGRGTGQGLAIARSVVVHKHHGTITFETEVGRGTAFIIRLPVVSQEGCEKKEAV